MTQSLICCSAGSSHTDTRARERARARPKKKQMIRLCWARVFVVDHRILHAQSQWRCEARLGRRNTRKKKPAPHKHLCLLNEMTVHICVCTKRIQFISTKFDDIRAQYSIESIRIRLFSFYPPAPPPLSSCSCPPLTSVSNAK